MGDQVAHGEFARHVGIRHPEPWQVVDDPIVPVQLSFVDQDRQGGGRKRLCIGTDGEQRLRVDGRWLAPLANTVTLCIDEPAVLHDPDRYPRHRERLHRAGDQGVDVRPFQRTMYVSGQCAAADEARAGGTQEPKSRG